MLRAALAAQGDLLWRNDRADKGLTGPGTSGPSSGTDHSSARPTDTASSGDDSTTSDDTTSDGDSAGRATGDPIMTTEPGADPGAVAQLGEPARPSEVDPTLAARSPAASRRVDALVALARAAPAAGQHPDDDDDLTEVLLVVDHDVLTLQSEVGRCQLNGGPTISAHTARRRCCDALIRPLVHRDGQPLDLGRAHRLANRAQRRALRFRDGPGCAFPGCAARHVDAHHIRFWDDGGRTDLENLVLLCRHHHRLLHEGGYTAALVDNRPRFYRPDGTPIRPPDPPPRDPGRGSTELRRRHRAVGDTITQRTAEARSGGAPWWSPQPALDALFT